MARARKATRHLHLVGLADEDAALLAQVRPVPKPETVRENAQVIDAFIPRRDSPPETLEVIAFLRPVLLALDLPRNVTKQALRFLPRLGVRMVRVGMELSITRLIGVDAVERYLSEEGAAETEYMKSRVTSMAVQIGRTIGMPDYPRRHRPHSRTERRAPYTDDEIEDYLVAASRLSQPQGDNATTLILLGRSGILSSRVADVLGTDIIRYRRRWSIIVPRAHPAEVRPLPAIAVSFLRKRAEKVGAKPLLRPGMSRGRCVTETIDQFTPHTQLPRFLVSRAVSAWQVDVLNHTGIAAFLRITGQSPNGSAVRDLFPYLTVPTTSECWALANAAAYRPR
ncbi:hypothetical protein MHY85_10495 [Cellulomonas sp. ACRRI]|uniref:hypothetical protein n=1 Tax=Cellulomonas sp. ACRRI TaxID=2918188 RepID=UPI001EF2E809|nr:hypothetical protein [Cellulomonas sp. ACRRI]MCG7286397.1 hypothetical protein [Cellulomonas sp. ACRRI]